MMTSPLPPLSEFLTLGALAKKMGTSPDRIRRLMNSAPSELPSSALLNGEPRFHCPDYRRWLHERVQRMCAGVAVRVIPASPEPDSPIGRIAMPQGSF